jgi:hypothetical protein
VSAHEIPPRWLVFRAVEACYLGDQQRCDEILGRVINAGRDASSAVLTAAVQMVNTTLQVIDEIKPGAGAELLADIGAALAEEDDDS